MNYTPLFLVFWSRLTYFSVLSVLGECHLHSKSTHHPKEGHSELEPNAGQPHLDRQRY